MVSWGGNVARLVQQEPSMNTIQQIRTPPVAGKPLAADIGKRLHAAGVDFETAQWFVKEGYKMPMVGDQGNLVAASDTTAANSESFDADLEFAVHRANMVRHQLAQGQHQLALA